MGNSKLLCGSDAVTEMSGIYQIMNLANGKRYVGSASNISKRWSRHRKDLSSGTHRNKHLQAAFTKYGPGKLKFEILEFTNELDSREQFWIDYLGAFLNGYNKCPIARSSRGRKQSDIEKESRLSGLKRMVALAQSPKAKASRTSTRRSQRTLGQILTWPAVVVIRELYESGSVTLSDLSAMFGVSPITIFDVIKFKTWRSDPNAIPS